MGTIFQTADTRNSPGHLTGTHFLLSLSFVGQPAPPFFSLLMIFLTRNFLPLLHFLEHSDHGDQPVTKQSDNKKKGRNERFEKLAARHFFVLEECNGVAALEVKVNTTLTNVCASTLKRFPEKKDASSQVKVNGSSKLFLYILKILKLGAHLFQ